MPSLAALPSTPGSESQLALSSAPSLEPPLYLAPVLQGVRISTLLYLGRELIQVLMGKSKATTVAPSVGIPKRWNLRTWIFSL